MPGLPPEAPTILEQAQESFSRKPMCGQTVGKFTLPHVRASLATARRWGASDQFAAAVYVPKATPQEALVVLRASDLAELLSSVERGAKV